MTELIHELTSHLTSVDGIAYHVWVLGERQADGSWQGWIEFHPPGSAGVLTTERLTTQSSRGALYYWAGRLELDYFESALLHAAPVQFDHVRTPAEGRSATDTSSSTRTPPHARPGC
jgi:hypothetical protein